MATYIVAYDLIRPNQDYSDIEAALRAYPGWCHFQLSVWLITSNTDSGAIYNDLSRFISGKDRLFVGMLDGRAVWISHDSTIDEWIKSNLGS